ncbi:MAG: hypothetical protein R6V54_08655 [Desulfobacteraceae bacterium]
MPPLTRSCRSLPHLKNGNFLGGTIVSFPVLNDRDLAGQITDLYPDIRLLFMSGYTANVIAHQGILYDIEFWRKVYNGVVLSFNPFIRDLPKNNPRILLVFLPVSCVAPMEHNKFYGKDPPIPLG